MIEVKSVYKFYGKFPALRGVTFSVGKGVIAGLLGPNGSGKTTTLKILVGLLRRNSGEVQVLGYDPWVNGVEVRGRVGILHERPIYPRDVSVHGLLKHLAKLRGLDDEEVKRVIKLVGLKEWEWKSISALSRGYLQRFGLAQALLGDPEILLLDEPTANLDPLARREILDLISILKRDLGITVIISSHIIPELQEVCNYAIFIRNGVVVGYGSLEELSIRYAVQSVYVIKTSHPRELAAYLIKDGIITGVDIEKDALLVRVERGMNEEFIERIDSIKQKFNIQSFYHKSSDLGELYEKVIRY